MKRIRVELADPKLEDESGRLAALHRYQVLDTPSEVAFERITGLVKTVLNVPICAISFVDADRQWFKSCVGLSSCETSRDVSFCSHTIMKRGSLIVGDAQRDARFAGNPLVTGEPFIRSYVGIPLSTPDGYNLGSLCAIDVVAREFNEQQVEILKSFAALVMDELELRRIAQIDSLTGAYARRGFLLELEKTLSRFERCGHPAALLSLDIDHFKRINDTYGHPTGDLVLRIVAGELVSQLRRSDTLGRLGGEEFGILLQDTGMEKALETAERLRAHVESCPVHLDPVRVTISFGVAALGGQIKSVPIWLKAADKALYEAKRMGRNRCCPSVNEEDQ